jgi:hypothetical protein
MRSRKVQIESEANADLQWQMDQPNSSGIFVLRVSDRVDKLVDIYQLDGSQGSRLVLSMQFALHPMDISLGPPLCWCARIRLLKPWFRFLGSI